MGVRDVKKISRWDIFSPEVRLSVSGASKVHSRSSEARICAVFRSILFFVKMNDCVVAVIFYFIKGIEPRWG